MAKIKLKSSQYNTILEHESNARLKAITDTLNEEDGNDAQLIEEGLKDVILGAALVISQAIGGTALAQSGFNKAKAEKAVSNDEIMSQIKATLDDELKTKELADMFKKMGLKDPDTLLANNAEKVKSSFNKIASDNNIKYRLDNKAVHSLEALSGKLKQGYALKDKAIDTDTIYALTPIEINDTLDIDFGSNNMFVTAGYELTPAGVDTVTTAINAIKEQGGEILSVNVESSTDAEPIRKYISDADKTGNITLADLRSKSVTDLISTLVGDARITHREIPNNGSEVVSAKEFMAAANGPKELAALRLKTAEFRYVRISITAVFKTKNEEHKEVDKIIKHYRFELVRVIMSTGKTKNIDTNVSFKHNKFKCSKKKIADMSSVNCSTF